jgi:hypothetical protein
VRTRLGLVVAVVVLLSSACEGRTADPAGDAQQGLDLLEVGVDLRTDTTRLFARYSVRAGGSIVWSVSVDSDQESEFTVELSDAGESDDPFASDQYQVFGGDHRCAGFVPNGGRVAEDRVELTIGTACLAGSEPGSELPDSVRVQASTYLVFGDGDSTGWTAVVPRS